MNFKHLFSGVLAMIVAISTVVAFSGELTTPNGAYWDPDLNDCVPQDAEGCTEEVTDESCEMEIDNKIYQIFKAEDHETLPCDVPLFRVLN